MSGGGDDVPNARALLIAAPATDNYAARGPVAQAPVIRRAVDVLRSLSGQSFEEA